MGRTTVIVYTLYVLLSLSYSESAEILEGLVVSIADGDTLTLQVDGEFHRIRLSEIDTPERDQPWGNESKAALVFKVEDALIQVTVVDADRYGRKVGKVWLDGRDVNRELVNEGHAWVYERYLLDETLMDDQELAKSEERGLWGLPEPIPPWQWRRR
jgi:micrococcal nuclease